MAKYQKIRSFVIIIIFILLFIVPATAIFYMSRKPIYPIRIDGRGMDRLTFSQLSPDGKHCLSIYYSEGKHATIGDACIVVVSAEESGECWKGKNAWSLYFGYQSTDISASWIDNETIIICSTENNQNQQFELKMNIYQDEF